MFTFKCSAFYTIIQWNCYKHLSHSCPGVYCRKSTAKLIRCWPYNLAGNCFTTCHIIHYRKLVPCRPYNSAVKTVSLQAPHNSTVNHKFVVDITLLTTNANSVQRTHFWQRMLIRCRQLNFGSKSQIRCKTYTFNNERWFATDNLISAVNHRLTAGNTF